MTDTNAMREQITDVLDNLVKPECEDEHLAVFDATTAILALLATDRAAVLEAAAVKGHPDYCGCRRCERPGYGCWIVGAVLVAAAAVAIAAEAAG